MLSKRKEGEYLEKALLSFLCSFSLRGTVTLWKYLLSGVLVLCLVDDKHFKSPKSGIKVWAACTFLMSFPKLHILFLIYEKADYYLAKRVFL
jgi:hypothetical protein